MHEPRYGRPPGSQQNAARRPGSIPTLEDFEELARSWQEQQAQIGRLTKEVQASRNEVAIHSEALKRQGEDLKKTQSDLLFTNAALAETRALLEAGDGEGWQERYTRLQAEVDNLRRRWEQRSNDEITEARHAILRDMLPLADHLEMALSHRSALESDAGVGFVNNIEATLRAFLDALRRYGVQQLESLGQPFNPERHEAAGQIHDGKTPAGHIAQVIQNGYVEGDRLLRPARVMVGMNPAG